MRRRRELSGSRSRIRSIRDPTETGREATAKVVESAPNCRKTGMYLSISCCVVLIHPCEPQDVQVAHNMQYSDFNQAWDKYMDEYDQMAQMYIQQMTEKHAVNLLGVY